MQTKPLYLEDSYQKTVKAKILEIKTDKEGKAALIVDQTIFYPQGGGQPSDQGVIKSANCEVNIEQVLIREGEILHYGKGLQSLHVGEEVDLILDWDRRYLNMRRHSAGHIVDFALFLLGYCPEKLKPLKGDHDQKPFISYEGVVFYDFREELERLANELIKRNVAFNTAFVDLKTLQEEAIYLQPNLPTNKPLRMLALEGVGTVADGGTQVAKTGEIGKITILPIIFRNNETDIYYQIS